jgi:hypothetical protein
MVGAWSSRPGLSGLAVTAAAGHALYLLDVLAVSFAVLTLEAEIHPALVAAVGGFVANFGALGAYTLGVHSCLLYG